ncbi:MAG: glycoside hydrolase family 3 N-terminal domain-containing protein [Pseudomonadota bacterium]
MSYSTRADIGHRLFVEPAGASLLPQEKDILSELRPMSYLFRARNFDFNAPYEEWLGKFTALIDEIRSCTGHKNLLLSIDHEGGGVVRPPRPITRFPYAAKWGEKVTEVSAAMAIELSALGLNLSWAPVADVLTNRASQAIGQRAFSSVTDEVTRKACLMADTLEAHGIAAGGKHFPGYGAVTEDAHYALPTASDSFETWERLHMPPFTQLVQNGMQFIMTAHVMYPALDPVDQATLSKPILSDILRSKLGFNGVIVADALGMGAIKDEIEKSDAVEKALLAELDLFCIAGDSVNLQTAQNLADQIMNTLNKGVVSEDLLGRSKFRIETAINGLVQHVPKVLPENTLTKHAALAHELDPDDEWAHFQYIPKGFD